MQRAILTIDGHKMRCEDDFYVALAAHEAVPDWIGHNLNALWDTLICLIDVPMTIDWRDPDVSRAAMGKNFEVIIELLLEAQAEKTAKGGPPFELKLDGRPT